MLLKKSFFARDAVIVAQELLGCIIEYNGCKGKIIETEAYRDDLASHGFRRTNRSAIMYDTYGHCYVYFIYGNHYCLNFTTNKDAVGAVLIRAVQPIKGINLMQKRRKRTDHLADGPGKLCKAFGINLSLNHTLINDKLKVFKSQKKEQFMCTPRIGIKKAINLHWRFICQ